VSVVSPLTRTFNGEIWVTTPSFVTEPSSLL
jgi:hypothetical protein